MNLRCLCSAIGILLVPSMSALATTMYQLGLRELAVESEKIVQAKVTAVVPQWNPDKKVITTYIRMNITDDLLGSEEDNEIIIQQPGGKVGALTLSVSGTAEYRIGEEDVLFLHQNPRQPAVYQTVGMFQGKYRVYTDPQTSTQRVAQDTTGNAVLLRKSASQAADPVGGYTLEQFKQLIIQYRNEAAH